METSCEIKLWTIALVLTIVPTQINAKISNCSNAIGSFEYLDENVVFCFSQESLSTYLDMAEIFDLDGMGYLVQTGECNFVPTGKYLPLENYETRIINSEPVIAAGIEDLTLWTSKKLVSEGNPEGPETDSGDGSMLTLTGNGQRSGQCR